ncbi:MAG: ABC transporter permease [Burkholderiales bacterium]
MPFEPVRLWTDVLVWILVAAVVGFAFYVRRHEHLVEPWRRVTQSKSGMVGLVVLAAFVVIGLLDSLHFRPRLATQAPGATAAYAVDVLSVLDILLGPLRKRVEKTYSAPLATELYARETVELADGRQAREYPRLRHGGAHLENPQEDWAPDVARRSGAGIAGGIAAWIVLATLLSALLARRHGVGIGEVGRRIWQGEMEVPWYAILLTLLAMLAFAGAAAALSTKYHLFGTDKVGQDVFYQALKSVRTGLVIGTLTTLVMLPFAIALGIMAGYFGGLIDDFIQYVYTTLNSIPGVLLIAAFVLMMQVFIDRHEDWFPTSAQRADLRLLCLCVILGVTTWTSLCRLLRGETLKLRGLEYVQAAHALGVSHLRIIARHLFPNVMHIVLISVVLEFSGLVLAEAVLSYVGVGVDPSTISFGTMINNARLEMAREPMVWWSLAAAFVFMFVMVLAANLFADAVRDAFDPRFRAARPFRLAAQNA